MVWTALPTPFKEDGSINFDEYLRILEFQAENGVDGVVILGTTGEAVSLSKEENDEVFRILKENAPKNLKLIAGTGTNNLKKVLKWTERVYNLGYDYALVVTPYYLKTSQKGLFEFFKEVSKVGIPIVLYNVPSRTGVSLLPSTVVELSFVENIVGIKEASGSCDAVSEILMGAREGFFVLSGDDSMTLPFLSIGAKGVVSVASNLFPRLVVDMVKSRDPKLHLKLYPLFKVLFVEPNPIPLKWAMKYLGFKMGPYRLPLTEPSEETKRKIDGVIDGLRKGG